MTHRWVDHLEPWKIHAGGAGGLLVLTLLGYLLAARPLMLRHAEAWELQHTLVVQQQTTDDLARQERTLRDELASIKAVLEESTLRLETAAFRNERLAELTELAAANQLAVDSLLTADVAHDERYDMVPITIEGTGDFPDCARFLHELNQRFRDTGVETFEIRGNPGPKPTDAFFRFEMIWYAAPSIASADEGGRQLH